MGEMTPEAAVNALSGLNNDSAPSGNEQPVAQPEVSTPPVENNGGGHPAWDKVYEDVFGILPEGFHNPVKERLAKHFSEWDSGVQNLTSKVHSEYEGFKPFKEAGIDPGHLEAAWQLFTLTNNDPKSLYEQLGQFLGIEQGQAPNSSNEEVLDLGQGENQEVDISNHPAFQQLSQQQQMLMQHLAQQQQAEEQRAADAWLDQKISGIQEKYGNDPAAMNYILNIAQVEGQKTGNFDQAFEKGVAAYETVVNSIRTAPRAGDSAPLVVPASGGSPVAPNPADLSDKDRRAVAAQMLQSAFKD